ncbi:hypothetical protein J6590_035752 [Homalodisca vitripennis]|nr:hypothetical protein J6590_035752 [Homalodisca vitripennis]
MSPKMRHFGANFYLVLLPARLSVRRIRKENKTVHQLPGKVDNKLHPHQRTIERNLSTERAQTTYNSRKSGKLQDDEHKQTGVKWWSEWFESRYQLPSTSPPPPPQPPSLTFILHLDDKN